MSANWDYDGPAYNPRRTIDGYLMGCLDNDETSGPQTIEARWSVLNAHHLDPVPDFENGGLKVGGCQTCHSSATLRNRPGICQPMAELLFEYMDQRGWQTRWLPDLCSVCGPICQGHDDWPVWTTCQCGWSYDSNSCQWCPACN